MLGSQFTVRVWAGLQVYKASRLDYRHLFTALCRLQPSSQSIQSKQQSRRSRHWRCSAYTPLTEGLPCLSQVSIQQMIDMWLSHDPEPAPKPFQPLKQMWFASARAHDAAAAEERKCMGRCDKPLKPSGNLPLFRGGIPPKRLGMPRPPRGRSRAVLVLGTGHSLNALTKRQWDALRPLMHVWTINQIAAHPFV